MRHQYAWVLLLGALAACSSQDRTRLAVTVYSDLSIPLEIDTLRFEVQGPTGAPQRVEYALATQETKGKVTLPVQTILVPQGKRDDAFTVTASGIKDRTPVITRTARLSFIPGEARELIIFLNRDCYQRTCVGDKTCIAGACVSNTVNSTELPTYPTNVKGKATSLDASSSNRDAAPGDTGAGDGRAEVGAVGDARPLADRTSDGQHDEAGTAQDAPATPFDSAADTSTILVTDAAPRATDSASTRLPDSGPVIVGPDTALSDSRPALDTTSPTDSALASDTPLLSPDTAVVSPDTAVASPDTFVASPDTPVDVPCPTGCTPGAKRCGTSGIQTCAILSNGCTDWGADQPCGARQSCTGQAPNAACTCNASGSSKCPLPGNTTGNFCESTDLLQSCNRDTDGCYYLGTPQNCSAVKPCSGDDGSASCSCGPTTAPCGTDVGTFCDAGNTQVVSCSFVSGCMVATPAATCPAGQPCAQTGPAAAECRCPIVAACDTASEMNRSYCSSNTVITCSPDTNNCQHASSVNCQTNQTCQESGSTASCVCINSACLTSGGASFSHQACDGEGSALTCGTVDSCPDITAVEVCFDGSVCRASGENARCLASSGWYPDNLPGTGSRFSTVLIGQPITASATGTLARIGLIVRSPLPGTGTVSVKMGVYSDAGGALLASVESPISVDRNEFTPSATVSLVSGSVYWVFAVFSVDSVTVPQTSTAGSRRTQAFNYANALPSTMSGTTAGSGFQTNYYLLISPP